jgi:hypothetical protein
MPVWLIQCGFSQGFGVAGPMADQVPEVEHVLMVLPPGMGSSGRAHVV